MNYRFVFMLVIIVTVGSCAKEVTNKVITNIPEGTFKANGHINFLPAELYTREGRVTEESAATAFAERRNLSEQFNTDGPSTLIVPIEFELTIDKDKQMLATAYNNFSYQGSLAELTDGIYGFRATDSSSISIPVSNRGIPMGSFYGYGAQSSIQKTGLGNLGLTLIRQTIDCAPVPISTGYSEVCKYKLAFPLEGMNSDMIYAPVLAVYYASGTGQYLEPQLTFYAEEWNILNPQFYKNLNNGDTVLIQKKQIVLMRK